MADGSPYERRVYLVIGARPPRRVLRGLVVPREYDAENSPLAAAGLHLQARIQQLAKALDDRQSDSLAGSLIRGTMRGL